MSDRPRLLDLFSGAGGCAVGYHRAGFDVTGVDNRPQKRYPFAFIQTDALDYLAAHGHEYDAIHASPPCQGYSRMRHLPWLAGRTYPLLIDPVRQLLIRSGRPWVIENVEGAPLLNGITLCGTMFGLKLYRHRRFESSHLLMSPPHQTHRVVIGHGRNLNDRANPNADGWVSLPRRTPLNGLRPTSDRMTVAGHFARMDLACEAMGIDWMTREELGQAIPPAYTEYVGAQLLTASNRPARVYREVRPDDQR